MDSGYLDGAVAARLLANAIRGAWMLLVLAASPALAQLESVLMPGQVIEGHAKLETECTNCHIKFDKNAQDKLCLDCHKPVAKDIAAKEGMHGRIKLDTCRTCHTEHKGRKVRIAPFEQKTFDHALSDFVLREAHLKPKCEGCHVAGKKFRDAPTACIACHKKDDKHKGTLGGKCADCHTDQSWTKTRFDHFKTRFRLTGKHVDVACKKCHADQATFKNTPMKCVDCHKKDDDTKKNAHKGRYGDKCATCHTDAAWNRIKFNHDRNTKYPLKGKHRTIRCDNCHGGLLYQDKIATTCIACHRKDDRHRNQLGDKCESCHSEASWKSVTKFNHNQSGFPLLGRHAKVECKACHTTPAYKDAKSDCWSCHAKDDKHKRTLGIKCETCHNAREWKIWNFNHDRNTRFVLDGGHRNLRCAACHKVAANDARLSMTCGSCHQKDDVHEGNFGRLCERCHVTSKFKDIKRGMGGVKR